MRNLLDAKTKSCPGKCESVPLVGSNLSAVANDPTAQPPSCGIKPLNSIDCRKKEKWGRWKKKKKTATHKLFIRTFLGNGDKVTGVHDLYLFIIIILFFFRLSSPVLSCTFIDGCISAVSQVLIIR